jgi:hypothetical protein
VILSLPQVFPHTENLCPTNIQPIFFWVKGPFFTPIPAGGQRIRNKEKLKEISKTRVLSYFAAAKNIFNEKFTRSTCLPKIVRKLEREMFGGAPYQRVCVTK